MSSERSRDEPLGNGRGAVQFGIVWIVGHQADLRSDAKLFGHVELVEPAVNRFVGATDGDLELGPVVVFTQGFIGGEQFLGFDGEASCLGLALHKLLKTGLDVLIGLGLRFVLGEPFHLIEHLLAAGLERLGDVEFLFRLLTLVVDLLTLGGGKVKNENIQNHEAGKGEEVDEFFFAV